MHKRLQILVTGRVQRVGYRGFARLMANRFGIFGYSENLPSGQVRIIAEGDEEALKSFVESLYAKDEPIIEVSSIDVKEQAYTSEFTNFEAHFGDFQKEMFQRSELALEYMKELIKVEKQNQKTQKEIYSILIEVKRESEKRREVLERVIEAIHTQGLG